MKSKIESYFSQYDGHPDQVLIELIESAKSSLDIAIYSLTKKEIANAIIEAKKRGINVRIITDKQGASNKYQQSVLQLLKQVGVPIKIDNHSGLMHLKITIIDENIVTTGSYNYTDNATYENDEVLVVISYTKIVNQFVEVFENMWKDNNRYKEI